MKLPPLKPGHTTTEFWLVVASGLISTALAACSLIDAAWAAGAVTILALAYNASRAKLKTNGTPPNDPPQA